MMRSRLYLRNSARIGLNLLIAILLIAGCSYSTSPTFQNTDVALGVENICKKEYKIDVKARLVGRTLWVYVPLEDIFESPKKPEKYIERFEVAETKNEINGGVIKLDYSIKAIPEKEKQEEVVYKKDALDAKDKVLRTVLRVLLSAKHQKNAGPLFFSIVTADIKYGFATNDLFYYHDLKKINYGLISVTEFQHRNLQSSEISATLIGDKEGKTLGYKDITMGEFITGQIMQRVKIKFQKPEVEKGADIDKEIIKAIETTVKIYDFRDFSLVELNNILTQNRIILNRAAIFNRLSEKKF